MTVIYSQFDTIIVITILTFVDKTQKKSSSHWSDFIWLKRIMVIVSVNDDNDKWTYKRWCIFKCRAETSIT